ncbi:MAG: hypothetical protein KJ852_17945 [Gammaproteobacteria bacterium]|nr:hypothetical protein [Gammaproteobacteria bacterium]MBU0785486.1 hypothetical protein [Gammaproteobacteria bacterium]MBU0813686.1 hypothetical protein [Gammaproteobacteria bacterium]MBU1788842.1 hypothetical protein [Gammaproteobacteria bacterium]
MTEFELFSISHKAIQALYNAEPDSDRREYYGEARSILWGLVKAAERRDGPPQVFETAMPGYLTMGPEGKAQTYAHPGLDGLDFAWRILSLGVISCSALHACDLVGDAEYPGNTLRNQLARAAAWVEHNTGSYEIAQAIRGIKVAKGGRITEVPQIKLVPAV